MGIRHQPQMVGSGWCSLGHHPRSQIRWLQLLQEDRVGRLRLQDRLLHVVGWQQGEGHLGRQGLAPVRRGCYQGQRPRLVQSHLPTRTQRRHLLLWLLGNGHPLQKTRGQDAQPIRCQVLARDLGFQAPLLAFLRERGGRTIHLRQGRVDLVKTTTRQSSGLPLLGSRSPHHHHHHLLPWPTSGEWEQKPRCCYSYFSFTSLQSGFYSQSSVVFKFRREFHVKNVFCFRLSFLSHFPIISLLYLFCIELLPIIYIYNPYLYCIVF